MARCGYHSPQFSEDMAWLPAWLQPHQLPTSGDDAKDEHTISQLSCKNLASLQKNVCNEQDGQLFTKGDAKYSGCHLQLSGEDNSEDGNTSSSANALHFHLHLSSVGVSQFSSGQLNEIPQTVNHETTEGSSKKPFHETPAVQVGTICQYKMDGGAPASVSPVGCKSSMSHKRISEPLIKADQKNHQRLQGKPDAGNLSNADINDAVELSIAASEAMVIYEVVSSGLQSEHLPAAAILEIALRVKHARNEHSDILESVSAFSADELDETDHLSDLDENTMADAFDDVGLSFTQIVGTPDTYCGKKSFHSNSSCDPNTHISERHYGHKGEAHSKKLKAYDVDVNGTTSQTYGAFAIESISKNLPLEPLLVQRTKPSAYVRLDCIKSCLKSQSKAETQKLHQNADALTAIQMGSEEDQGIHKDNKVATLGDVSIRKSIKVFNGETSYISESMDVMDESTSEHRPEAEPEIVASSSTPFRDLSRCPYKESERSIHEGLVLSQDLVRSSSLSLVDPLCSVVPCSISSDDAPIVHDPNEKGGKMDREKFMDSTGAVGLQKLNEKDTLPNVLEIPLKRLAQDGESILSKNGVEDPCVPSRKQFNSLMPYSMVMPDLNTRRQIVFNYGPFPSHSRVQQFMHFSPTERNINWFLSNKNDAGVSMKPMDKCMDVDGSKSYHSHGNKDHEEVEGPSAIGETKDDDNAALIHHHEERCSPIILNNKKRRHRACKIILSSEGEEENLKRSPSLKIRKYRTENSTYEVRCRDQTNFTSCIPLQSSLRSHPADKQSLQNKRVRFLEAKSSIDRTKSIGRLQSNYRAHGSHHGTSRRVKQSNLQYKSVSGKEKYNYLTCCQTVDEKGMIFQGLEFLLTGFSSQKEKELEALIRLYGGYVLSNIPSSLPDLKGKQRAGLARWKLPIVLSPKKVQTTKFLYGCATNTWMLNAHWLVDSIQACSILPPGKYMTRLLQGSERNQLRIGEPFCFNNHTFIFDRVGIMLYGKVSFCTKFSKIIKHGGGQVYKSLQRLTQSLKNGTNTLGAVLVETEGNVSRHLKHCALENNLQTMPARWIVNSLFSGKLLPFKKDRYAPLHKIKMPTFSLAQDKDMSEEI